MCVLVIFGRAFKYGIAVWQCRHTEICSYIQKVLQNSKVLIENKLLQKLVIIFHGKDLVVKDEISVELQLRHDLNLTNLNANDLMHCDIDFKSSLLRLLIHLENMPLMVPETDTWALQCQTHSAEALAAQSLTDGQLSSRQSMFPFWKFIICIVPPNTHPFVLFVSLVL